MQIMKLRPRSLVIVPEIVVAGLDSEGESLSVSKLELDGKE
jgi:hypothetical protein